MSGKRAKPTPWRFLRAAPVVVIAVVVWVLVGFFLLLPDSGGGDQAHDWGVDPIPSSSDDDSPSERDSSSASSPEPSTPGTEAASHPTAEPEDDAFSRQPPAPDVTLSRASTSRHTPQPAPLPTSDAPSPTPSQPVSVRAPDDNPGKKKGHDKPHGPPRDKP